MKTYDILVPGNYFCDIVFTGFPQFPALGSEVYTEGLTVTIGGVLNTVIGLHRLGVNVGWLGVIGSDFFSRFAREMLDQEGIDQSLVKHIDAPFQRVTAAISYPHERAFITYVDPAPSSTEMVLEALDSVRFRHLHFTGFQTAPRAVELLQAVRRRGVVVSMDCQDRPITLETPGMREVLSLVDIFMPNAIEAQKLTEQESVEAAAERLQGLTPLVIVKDGANGAHAWRGGEHWHAPAIPVTPVDTTGAGDVFNAGFLTAFREGKAIDECLRWGNICGGLSTLGRGGVGTAPRRKTVESYPAG
ncbi:MAG: carbohydrate kinase family protein [Anaerolineae bacterium]|nr:carbohydrate kinase family protein [Anaerolineae bacterium]